MGLDSAAILTDLTVTILERTAPRGIELISSVIKGKKLLIVGPSEVGKTTFIDYLQYGIFSDEQPRARTLEKTSRTRFNVKLGKEGALQLSVKGSVDIPGQYGPLWHADHTFHTKPHALIIMLSLTAPLEGQDDKADAVWLTHFCKRLEAQWRAKGKRGNRTKTIIVVMNKVDKVDTQVVNAYRKRLQEIVDAELHQARGKMLEPITVLPCSVVTNPNGTKAVDAVITQVALALVR